MCVRVCVCVMYVCACVRVCVCVQVEGKLRKELSTVRRRQRELADAQLDNARQK